MWQAVPFIIPNILYLYPFLTCLNGYACVDRATASTRGCVSFECLLVVTNYNVFYRISSRVILGTYKIL
jgi:hypothetical protein